MQIPNLELMSWMNHRLPELLWSALLIVHLDRRCALSVFRRLAEYGRQKWRDAREPVDITHTGLSRMADDSRREILELLCSEPGARSALSSLAMLSGLPAKSAWDAALRAEPSDSLWEGLKCAVARTLDHQSQEATDCRWSRLIFHVMSGRIHFADHLQETAKEIVHYPGYGDLRKVRPTVRATEGSLAGLMTVESDWPDRFWWECLDRTPCVAGTVSQNPMSIEAGTTLDRVRSVADRLIEHCTETRTTTAVDAEHDAVFGLALLSLWLLRDLLRLGVNTSAIGRLGLRSLLHWYVTLSHLVKEDDPQLWTTYRNYGAGQAKLAFLKLDEAEHAPSFIDTSTLGSLANEDYWMEYVSIDFGHWDKTNLRKMSDKADVKAEYDLYYPWTSGFAHGHWAAVRNAVYQTCLNPLHRLHRVPRPQGARTLNDVVPDACSLVDSTLGVVDRVSRRSRIAFLCDGSGELRVGGTG